MPTIFYQENVCIISCEGCFYISILVFEKNDQDDKKITGGNWKKKSNEKKNLKIFKKNFHIKVNINKYLIIIFHVQIEKKLKK